LLSLVEYAQPGPDSIGIVAISHGCSGVAARACGLVGLEPTRVSSLDLLLFTLLIDVRLEFIGHMVKYTFSRLPKSSKIGLCGIAIAELLMFSMCCPQQMVEPLNCFICR